MYSNVALQKGAHSLFFPGGTRSRSGMIEKQLKLGLLSTSVEAQRNLYLENPEGEVRKIFVVPVTLNYHFVLEAPDLIEDYLQVTGKNPVDTRIFLHYFLTEHSCVFIFALWVFHHFPIG